MQCSVFMFSDAATSRNGIMCACVGRCVTIENWSITGSTDDLPNWPLDSVAVNDDDVCGLFDWQLDIRVCCHHTWCMAYHLNWWLLECLVLVFCRTPDRSWSVPVIHWYDNVCYWMDEWLFSDSVDWFMWLHDLWPSRNCVVKIHTRWHSTDRQEKRKRRGEGERGGERATDRQTEREMGDGVVFLWTTVVGSLET